MRRILLLALVLALAPATTFAVTVSEIVALSKAGVSEAVILALIERDKTIYALTPDQLVALKHEGLSEPIVIAMLKSGRQEPPPPPPAPVTEVPYTEPNIVVVGHGPERPNPPRDAYSEPPPAYPVPYAVPYFVPVIVNPGYGTRVVTPPPVVGHFFTGGAARGVFFTNPSPPPSPFTAPAADDAVPQCGPRCIAAATHAHRR